MTANHPYLGLSSTRRAELALLAVCVLWGCSFTLTKDGMRFTSPLVFVAMRMCVATAVMLAIYRRGLDRAHVRGGLIVGAAMFMGFALQTSGLQLTQAGRNAFITQLSLPLTPVCQAAISGRRPRPLEVAGIPAALLGIYLITRPSADDASTELQAAPQRPEYCAPAPAAPGAMGLETKGDLLSLGCALFFALQIVTLNLYAGAEKGESAFKTVAVLQLAVTGSLSLLFCALLETPCLHPAPRLWADVSASSLLATALTFTVFTWSMKFMSATRSSLICTTEAVWAFLSSGLVSGERMGALNCAGAALILAAVTASDWLPMLVPAWRAPPGEPAAWGGGEGGSAAAHEGEALLSIADDNATGDGVQMLPAG